MSLAHALWIFMFMENVNGFFTLDNLSQGTQRYCLMLFATFFGIIAAGIVMEHRKCNSKNEKFKLRAVMQNGSLIVAGFIAPIILASVYHQLETTVSSMLVFLVASQNGFFSEIMALSISSDR